ncbi:MAG: PQQ-dependent sugar dehydrogenase [Fimbriimonadaceae bacterium]|nr:PQQ-dependent sugar dehydrogenase [Fimbriimonadaceae bacterium]
MTKWPKALFVLPWAAVACAVPMASRPEPAPDGPPNVEQNQRINVTKLYDDTCAKCHGNAAQGGGGGTRSLITEAAFEQANDKPFFDAIKNGVPDMGMEAFGGTLSDEAIWSLVVHIRELQARGLREKNGSPKAANGVYSSKYHRYRIETVVDTDQGLVTPWAVDWLPDGRMLVTNRGGTLNLVVNGKVGPAIKGVPAVAEIGQGGLMEVSVHPNYAKNGWVYLAYTEPGTANPRAGFTKIVRGKLRAAGEETTWSDQQTIFEVSQDNYSGSGIHFGSRIVFDGKGHVFFSIGERGSGERAQDLTRPNGKIYRLNEDGTIPADNPFASAADKEKGHLGAIWSYGHRNPQGLVFDLNGDLWDTEHAPRGGDEVNRIEKGANYGWPIVSFGINYNDSPYSTPWPKAGQNFRMPAYRWLPSIGACGLDLAKGPAFAKWKGDLLAGGLSGANVERVRMKNGQMVEHEELVHGMGRVRDVATAPDGTVYVVLNDPHKIVRLVPAD